MLASVNIGGATILALIVIAVIVLALAAYLLAIIAVLTRVASNLESLAAGARTIADQTTPAPEVVGGIAGNVMAIRDALGGLLRIANAPPALVAAGPAPLRQSPPPLPADAKPIYRTSGRVPGRGRRVGFIHREN